uniref:Uncharacterized protein n=1 Tax=Suricata suricatta TaxID=37032 RepID=A0A673VAU2_SURSU
CPSSHMSKCPVAEADSTAGACYFLAVWVATGSPPSNPVTTTAKADAASAPTVDVTSPSPKAPSTVEDRVCEPSPAGEKPVSAVTDASASESP